MLIVILFYRSNCNIAYNLGFTIICFSSFLPGSKPKASGLLTALAPSQRIRALIVIWLASASAGDVKPPEFATWDFSPTSVNTANSDQTITFSAHLEDDMSGLHYGIAWFNGPRSQQVYVWFRYPNELVSGTRQDGIYKSKMTVPQFSGSGQWKLNYIVLFDRTDNAKFVYPRDLSPMGLPFAFEVTN